MQLAACLCAVAAVGLFIFTNNPIHTSDIQALEDEVISSLYGNTMRSAWKEVSVNTLQGRTEQWLTHYLEPSHRSTEKTDVMLLHGYGATSAFTWRVTIPALTEKFNVYAIDMPGFGRTDAPQSLLETDMQDTHDAYCEFYKSAMTTIGIKTPYVVAHSFGGFVFTQCAARHPEILTKLLLVSVPGIFPSNGGLDFLWSNYFYLGLPQNALKLLGDWAHYVYDAAVFLSGSRLQYPVIRYWHLYHTDERAMQADVMVRKFIKHSVYSSIGTATSLVPLLNLGAVIPVMTVYGTKDIIVPHEQGELIQNISFNRIRTRAIEGANHVTYVHNGGDDFSEIMHQFYDEDYHPVQEGEDEELHTATNRPVRTRQQQQGVAACLAHYQAEWNTYPCVPSYLLSNHLQRRMYASIRHIVEQKCDPPNLK